MQVDYINPFIVAVTQVFESSIGTTLRRSKIGIKESDTRSYDVSGIVGFSGSAFGSVALSFPKQTAKEVVTAMLGGDEANDDDIADGVGELANMVAGVAKTALAERGVKTFISIPRAVIGAGHYVHRPKNVQCVEIKFESDMGTVVLDLAIRVVAGVSASVSNA